MPWQSRERLDDLAYKTKNERDAFRAGYSDGYLGYPRDPGDWPYGTYDAAHVKGQDDSGYGQHKLGGEN